MSNNPKLTDAKRAYAQKIVAAMAAKGVLNPVVVLPEFMEEGTEWVPTGEAAVPSGDKGFGYVSLLQVRTVMTKGAEFDNELWAIHRGRVTSLEAKYKPGQCLPGHIVIEDTLSAPNPNDTEQGTKLVGTRAGNDIPCSVGGNTIYQLKYWDPSGTISDTTIPHDNGEEIANRQALAKIAGNGQSSGLRGAAAKQLRITELSAIASNKRTAAQKKELAELVG